MYAYHVLLHTCQSSTLEVCPSRVLKVCLSRNLDIWPVTYPRGMSITYLSVHTRHTERRGAKLNPVVAPNVKMANNKRSVSAMKTNPLKMELAPANEIPRMICKAFLR